MTAIVDRLAFSFHPFVILDQPCEVLLPPSLSRSTEKVFEHLCRNPEEVRLERMTQQMVDAKVAAQRLSLFCKGETWPIG